MRMLLVTISFLLLQPIVGNALIRSDGRVPMLHSVLDDRPRQAYTSTPVFTRISLADAPDDHQKKIPGSPQDKHDIGVALLVFGSMFLAGSLASFIVGATQKGYIIAPGIGIGILLALPGLAFFIPGLHTTLKYRKSGNHPWIKA